MEFRILGPVEVHGESGVVALGAIKLRAVLAVLLLHPNESVHAERLALALWGEDAPAGSVKTVQVYVSRLRKALGDAEILVTTSAGYSLRVRSDELDAERFARLVEEGRRALAAGQVEHAATVLREALALWRGPPLADLASEPFAQAEIARLQEQRLAAVEVRVQADVAAGRHAAIVGELRHMVASNPTRERLVGQLMLALYRCGQQADALEAFHAARHVLVGEIGVEPGPELRRLQQAILRHDASLEFQQAVAELPHELDAATAPPLVGRGAELAVLHERWEQARSGHGSLVTVTGVRGIGKSRLAAEVAREVHRCGAVVVHCSGRRGPEAMRAARLGVGETSRATLLVIDDADDGGDVVRAELERLTRAVVRVPVLALALAEDAEALAGLGADGTLSLQPLDREAVGAIARLYAPAHADEDVPAQRLLDAAGGVPGRTHELASQWARREASRRVSAAAERARAGRVELRSIEAELAGDVVELQATGDRSERRGQDAAIVVCPFKGLAFFDVVDAPYFFGRERLIAELVARLVGTQLLGVVGASGSGKSSAVRAGLLPALAGGVLPGSGDWVQVLMRPGEHPLTELGRVLADNGADRRVLLVVDQFEELFTVCADEAERAEFIAKLGQLIAPPAARFTIVLALRADFYGRCAAFPELAAPLATSNVLVRAMSGDELRLAIERPAQRAGLRIEPELVEALVTDVEREPGGLPLLSTALLELWQQRDGRQLRLAAYARSGGVRGAVARLAEGAFEQLDEPQQAIARRVFLRLTGEGVDGALERRRVALAAFETARDEDVARVVALLTDRRLLTVSSGSIEVAHESLLREWPRLRGWIEADREGLRIQRAVTVAAEEWQRLGRDDGALYRGTRLTEALERRDMHDAPLNTLEHEFLTTSQTARTRERVTRRRRLGLVLGALTTGLVAAILAAVFADRQRDIAESRDLATKSSTLLATDPGLALALALEALRRSDTEQAQNAVRQATLEHRAKTVIAAHKGLVFGVAASADGRLAATAGADRAVRIWSLGNGRRVAQISGYRAEVRAVSFSHDGKRVASAARDGEIAVAATDGGSRRVVARLQRDYATSIDFDVDGQTLAIGTDGGRVALLRLSDGALRDLTPSSIDRILAVDFDSAGRRVVSAGADGFARIWNVAGGPSLKLAHGSEAVAASFSPDGTRVATAGLSGAVVVWEASSGRRLMRISVTDTPLASVRFSGDGRRIVIGGFDGVIRVAAVREGAVLAELRGHHGPARADVIAGRGAIVSAGEEDGTLRTWSAPAARIPTRPGSTPRFSPDGRLVVSGDDTGSIHVWNPVTGQERDFHGHKQTSIPQFSPDGTQIISASFDGSVLLWNVNNARSHVVATLPGATLAAAIDATGQRIAIGGSRLVIQAPDGSPRVPLRGHQGRVNALVFSPDDKHLLTGSDDGTARIWNARSGALERTLRGHEGVVLSVSYSADGQKIATTGSDATVRIWTANGGAPVILAGHEGAVNTAEFNPRGDRLVSAGDDGTIRIWDTAGGDALVLLHRHEGIASGADFSADGRDVVSAGNDGMRITPCEVCTTAADALRLARTRAQHTLSATERQRLLPGG